MLTADLCWHSICKHVAKNNTLRSIKPSILITVCASPVKEMPVCLSPEVSQVGPVSLQDLVQDQDQGRAKPARDIISFACDVAPCVKSLLITESCFSSCLQF